RLLVIVVQHQIRNFIGHGGQYRIALFACQASAFHGGSKGDLDIHFDIGGINARRIVDCVGVAAPALEIVLDTPALGHAQIGPFANHGGAHIAPSNADRVI